jgi:capsular polysaccharide transport system permease protein
MNLVHQARTLLRRADPLFLACVVVPGLLAALYFGILASEVYVSESRFVIRSPDKKVETGVEALLKSGRLGAAGDEAYAVKSYILSRDALAAVNKNGAYEKAYRNGWFNAFDHFPGLSLDDSTEHLFRYYLAHVRFDAENSGSIDTLTVRAFTPRDAQRINAQLLDLGEDLVNRLNERGRTGLLRDAQREVDEARRNALSAASSLSSYRNNRGVLDPEKQAQVQIQMISKLQSDLIEARNQRDQMRAVAPQSPQLDAMNARISGLESQIGQQTGQVAGQQNSLAASGPSYQRLAIASQVADRQLASALSSLEDARQDARRKHVYIARIAEPSLPDEAVEPRRLRGFISTVLVGLVIYGCLRMLIAGMLEHRD